MTVEEIKAMCNSVMNASKQMDNDYEALKRNESDKNSEIAIDVQNFLTKLENNYLESAITLGLKVEELTKSFKNQYGWRKVDGLCIDARYIYSDEIFIDKGRKILCGIDNWYKEHRGFVFAVDYMDSGSSIKVWQYDGDLSPLFIDTACENKCRSYWTEKAGDVIDTLKKASQEDFPRYSKRDLTDDLYTIINNGEDMIQKLIAKMSQVILDLSAERNKAVTDRL